MNRTPEDAVNIQELIWDDFFAHELPSEGFTMEMIDKVYFILPMQKTALPLSRHAAAGDCCDQAAETESDPVLTDGH
jgi:hypothetical protein